MPESTTITNPAVAIGRTLGADLLRRSLRVATEIHELTRKLDWLEEGVTILSPERGSTEDLDRASAGYLVATGAEALRDVLTAAAGYICDVIGGTPVPNNSPSLDALAVDVATAIAVIEQLAD